MLSVCNSTVRLAAPSYPLDDRAMPKPRALAELKFVRRERLRQLWDSLGGAELASLTGIDKAYLYQMAMGRGRNARGISDKTAATIESAAGKPEGWLSGEEARIAEESASYSVGDRALLRKAIIQVECQIDGRPKRAAEMHADIILGAYDMLRAGRSEETVAGFLSGIRFASPSRTSKV